MTFAWVMVGVSATCYTLSLLIRGTGKTKTKAQEPVVELCSSDDFQHIWGKWGAGHMNSDPYDWKHYQVRRCDICGLGQQRQVQTVKK